jgi:SAM-dependent methyltransferase
VAFGQGATLRELCVRYGTENVTGINIASDQVEHARQAGIACDMHVMDAAELDFPAGSFDGILCVEAAFHFRSRASFLNKAFDVLRPGGVLVLSDFLLRGTVALDHDIFPPENITNSVQDYRQLFAEAGFSPSAVTVEITTNRQLVPFLSRMLEFSGYLPQPDPDVIRIEEVHSQVAIQFVLSRLLNISDTAIVTARR